MRDSKTASFFYKRGPGVFLALFILTSFSLVVVSADGLDVGFRPDQGVPSVNLSPRVPPSTAGAGDSGGNSTFNITYNNLLLQQCPGGQVVNGTLANGTLVCIAQSGSGSTFLTDQVRNNLNITSNVSFNRVNATQGVIGVSTSAGNATLTVVGSQVNNHSTFGQISYISFFRDPTASASSRLQIDSAGTNVGFGLSSANSRRWEIASYDADGGANHDFTFYNSQTNSDGLFIKGENNNLAIAHSTPRARIDLGALINETSVALYSDATAKIGFGVESGAMRLVTYDANSDWNYYPYGSARVIQMTGRGNINATGNFTGKFYNGNGSRLTDVCLSNGTNCAAGAGGSSFNTTYNNLINQQCPTGTVVNGTLTNGTLSCITVATASALNASLFFNFTDQNNSGTSETNLYAYSIPANTMTVTGDRLTIDVGGNTVGSTSSKRIQFYVNSTNVYDSGAVGLATAGSYGVIVQLVRTSSSTLEVSTRFQTSTATTFNYDTQTEIPNVDFTKAIQLNITGTASGVGAATNDIAGRWFIVLLNGGGNSSGSGGGGGGNLTIPLNVTFTNINMSNGDIWNATNISSQKVFTRYIAGFNKTATQLQGSLVMSTDNGIIRYNGTSSVVVDNYLWDITTPFFFSDSVTHYADINMGGSATHYFNSGTSLWGDVSMGFFRVESDVNLTQTTHINHLTVGSGTGLPTITTGTGSDSGTLANQTGGDTAGEFCIDHGGAPGATDAIFATVTYSTSFSAINPSDTTVVLQPTSEASTGGREGYDKYALYTASYDDRFEIWSGSVGATVASRTYCWGYHVIGVPVP